MRKLLYLEENEHQLRQLFDEAPVAYHEIDRNGIVQRVNRAECALLGYEREEMVGKPVWMFVAPDQREVSREAVRRKIMEEQPLAPFYRAYTRQDGSTIIVEIHEKLIRDERGAVIGIRTALMDCTERKRAEEALAKERNLLRAVMDNLPDFIFVKDTESRFITTNVAHARSLGAEAVNEVAGKTDFDFFPEEVAKKYYEDEQAIIRSGQPLIDREELVVDRSGNPRWVSTTKVVFTDSHGQLMGIVGMSRDISERKRLEAQLIQRQKMESIGHLAAGMAHEINSPIQYVGDNIQFLQDSFSDLNKVLQKYGDLLNAAKNADGLQDIIAEVTQLSESLDLDYLRQEIPQAISQSVEGVERVASIVRAMKEFSHPGTIEMKAVNINEAINSTLTVSRNEWKYVAEVVTDFDPQLPLVRCLPGEFNQMVLNLIVNAAHAIADSAQNGNGKGKITVTTRRVGESAVIRISDTGTGIPAAVQPKIFTPFFTTKEVGRGTGQGLSIAHSMVKKLGGSISFETEEHKGTTFVIELPIS